MDEKLVEKLENFFFQYKQQLFKKGEILIRADEEPNGVYYLKLGKVKEYAISKKGEELIVNMFKPISFFPMSWAFNQTPNNFYYEAIDEVTVWRAPRNAVVDFIKNEPEIVYNLLSRVFKGTDGLLQRTTYLMAGNAHARLVSELIIQANRFGTQKDGQIQLEISEKDLAAQSGMTRETISRELKVLKAKNLVTFTKNKLSILDMAKIEEQLYE